MGAHDVGLDEFVRSMDRAVHVGFSGKMDNGVNIAGGQQGFHQGLIQDVAMDEFNVGGGFGLAQVVTFAGIGQGIQDNNLVFWMMVHPVVNKVGADKTGTAGDKQHGSVLIVVIFGY
jgi:hypothetical protein